MALGAAHSNARFSEDQRAEAVRLFLEERLTKTAIAARLGCHRESVSRWLHDLKPASFAMPASSRRVRKGPEVEAAKTRTVELGVQKAIIAARRAEREAQK